MGFDTDNAWQREIRDRLLAPFYRGHSLEGRYVFVDKGRLASELQRRFAVDTILQGRDGEAICIEEKLTRPPAGRGPFTNFFLETDSCTNPGSEAPGWMRYGRADYLLYGFVAPGFASLLAYLIDFPGLRAWFDRVEFKYQTFTMPKTPNHTRGRLVPIADVRAAVKTWIIRCPM
jgi:hypothetical protein